MPVVRRISLMMKSESKTVTFYKNGDEFSAYVVTITQRKYRNFDILLTDLAMKTELPVRYLLDKENGARVNGLDELKHGKEYICASNAAKLRRMDYGKTMPRWGSKHRFDLPPLSNPPKPHNTDSTGRDIGQHSNPTHPRRMETKERRLEPLNRPTIKPRIINVYRNGKPKDSAKKLLLNKRTAQTMGQVLDQANDVLSDSGGSNIRKLYTTCGKQILQLSELYADESGIFIAVGSERFKPEDLESINTQDVKHVASHKRTGRPHHANEGMLRYKHKEHEIKRGEKSPRHENESGQSSLPKLNDANNNHSRIKADNHRPARSPAPRKHHSPKHKRPLGKQTQDIATDSKHTEKKTEPSADSIKLPQIGDGHLVTKHSVVSDRQDNSGQQSNSDGPPDHVSPRDQETGRKNSKGERPAFAKKKQSRKTSLGLQEEIQYSRVTDKKVEEVYDIGRKIGDGNFAVVRQCTDKITHKELALKIVDKRKIKGKEKMIDDEIAIMRRCRHPNIVRLYEDYDTPTEIYLVMEFVKGGDLFDAISSSVKFTETVAKSYFRDICKALAYLHKRRIVHRDLKPENLLVHKRPNGQSILKLADFGLAMDVTVPIFTVCGTPTYVAPEILEESGYGLKVDMWAAGVITYIMLCGFPPFRSPNRDQDELFDLIQAGEFEFLSPYWDPVSDDAKDLISRLLVVEPGKRASAEQVLQHSWARQRSPTIGELSQKLLEDGQATVKSRKRFKAAAIAVRGTKRLEKLVVDFHREKFISA